MEAELVEPESSTGPKKSKFKRAEPPLAAESGAAEVNRRQSERAETRTDQRERRVTDMLLPSVRTGEEKSTKTSAPRILTFSSKYQRFNVQLRLIHSLL